MVTLTEQVISEEIYQCDPCNFISEPLHVKKSNVVFISKNQRVTQQHLALKRKFQKEMTFFSQREYKFNFSHLTNSSVTSWHYNLINVSNLSIT